MKTRNIPIKVRSCTLWCIYTVWEGGKRKGGVWLDGDSQERKKGECTAGKNLKNRWRAQRKWGREKKERQARSRGGTSERGEVKKWTRKRSRGEKRKNNSYCMKETEGGNKTKCILGKEGVGGGVKDRRKLDRALGLLSLAPAESCTERTPVYWGWWEREYEKHIFQQTPTQLK